MIANGGTEADAEDYLTKFFNHVAALPGSGRDATNTFLQGAANVLISYENEAILARQSGEDFDYIVPAATLKIENPGCGAEERQSEGQGLPRLRAESRPARRSSSRRASDPSLPDTPIGEVAGANNPAKPFPVPAQAVHHQRSRVAGMP